MLRPGSRNNLNLGRDLRAKKVFNYRTNTSSALRNRPNSYRMMHLGNRGRMRKMRRL